MSSSAPIRAPRGPGAGRFDVAVTGASGTVGPALLRRLAAASPVDRVIVLGRRETAPMREYARGYFRRVDVRNADAVERAVAGAEVVVHIAFSLYGVLMSERELFETNVRGTANVARAAVRVGALRLVCLSSAAVYGGRGGQRGSLRETCAMHAPARLFYARHKAQAELVLRQETAGSSTDVYVLRPCGIVGPHAAGVLAERLPAPARRRVRTIATRAAHRGLRPLLPPPAVPLQFVHEDDVAQAVELAVLGAGPPGTYNLAGDGVVSGAEAVSALGLRRLPVPPPLVRASLRLFALVPPLVPALGWSELIREPVLIDTEAAGDRLGWRPRHTSAEALAATRAAIGW